MIVFEDVSKVYAGGTEAVSELSLEVRKGETLVLLGTSGSGKTTTLKMVNRLIEPTAGRILIEGTDVMDQDPIQLRRRIGYAIQGIGLFPHMSVAENISIVPKLLRWSYKETTDRVCGLLTMVGLEPDEFWDRSPGQLSGGQRQRIGVARALAADPPMILMDEPFGALDPITREQLQNEFIELETRLKKTILFVTHDIFEAVKMGDRIALLHAGRLQQLATPSELVDNPANVFVDSFLGQHRFQLSLLTKTVKAVMAHNAGSPVSEDTVNTEVVLRATGSLVEALDMFKRAGCSVLPVYEGGHFLGTLRKGKLLTVISQVLEEMGETP
ncbi:MAG: ABC transporter ATP-binding protein [bacterium]